MSEQLAENSPGLTATQRLRALMIKHHDIFGDQGSPNVPIVLAVTDEQMASIAESAAAAIEKRHDAAITDIHARLTDGDMRMQKIEDRTASLESGLQENTALTQRVVDSTSEIVDIFSAAKGFFKFLERVGKLAKPLWVIAVTVGAVAGAITAVIAAIGAIRTGTAPSTAAADAFREMMRYVIGEPS